MIKLILPFCLLFIYTNYAIGQSNYKEIEKLAQKCSEGQEKSCNKLVDIAKNDKDAGLRSHATKFISDLIILTEIARTDNNQYVRGSAIEKIIDQNVLAEVAKHDWSGYNRQKAIDRITDQIILINIAKNPHYNTDIRCIALHKITDENVKIEIAKKKDDDINLRLDAITMITNQNVLLDLANSIVNNDEDKSISEEAVNQITDQALLIDLIKNSRNTYARIESVRKIKDQNILVEIIDNTKYIDVLEKAVECLTNENLIIDLAKNGKNQDTRIAAIKRIYDESILIDLAKNDKDPFISATAVEYLSNSDILIDIAINDKRRRVREAAIKNVLVNDLPKIIINIEDYELQKYAVSRIRDKGILTDIANNVKDVSFSVLILFNELDVEKHYQHLINIINQNISIGQSLSRKNLTELAALKVIPCDKILIKYYSVLKIIVDREELSEDYIGAEWEIIDYKIEINTNDSSKTYEYLGERGDLVEEVRDVYVMHEGDININEICEDLLSPVRRDDLIQLSKTSDVYYLRETAKRMLERQK